MPSKLPEPRQHRLNLFPEPQGHGSLRPSFSQSSLSPWTKPGALFHAMVSEGKPLRRLLVISRKPGCR